jgi:hypothetical protein
LAPDLFHRDAQQHVWWTYRFADPRLFPGDFIARFFAQPAMAPPGIRAIYGALAPWMQARQLRSRGAWPWARARGLSWRSVWAPSPPLGPGLIGIPPPWWHSMRLWRRCRRTRWSRRIHWMPTPSPCGPGAACWSRMWLPCRSITATTDKWPTELLPPLPRATHQTGQAWTRWGSVTARMCSWRQVSLSRWPFRPATRRASSWTDPRETAFYTRAATTSSFGWHGSPTRPEVL